VGLPPEGSNGEQWDGMIPLLENPDLAPGPEDIGAAHEGALELLQIRTSSELFRLGSAEAIEEMVTFPNGGADATPGLLVMSIDDTTGRDVDPELDRIVTVFNASPDPITESIDGLAGIDLTLHETQQDGADDRVRETAWDAGTGTVTVPGRTVAVLVQAQDGEGPGPDPDPTPAPPAPGKGFYLNDGWDGRADHEFSFGRVGDRVLVGDWDGDGADSFAVRRGNAYFLTNSLYGGDADVELRFGRAGDEVLVGDWDGDGVDSFAVRRGNAYFLSNSFAGGNADVELTYGRATDEVFVGDWNGDGVDTLGVRR
jgi:hypothetical protein